MRIGDAEYTKLVDKLMGHKHTQLTESECESEVKEIVGGAVSSFAESDVQDRTVNEVQPIPPYVNSIMNKQQSAIIPRKRGRPKGSRNRPKSGS